MMITAEGEDSNYNYGGSSMTQRMTVTVTDEVGKNCYCKLFILNVILIMITMAGIMNVKLKYF